MTEIVLNVKSIIARLHSEEPKTVYIEAVGEGVVTPATSRQTRKSRFSIPSSP